MEENKKSSTEANKKWQEKNKEYSNYLKSRSTSRGFIKNRATLEDIEELEELMNIRREELKELFK